MLKTVTVSIFTVALFSTAMQTAWADTALSGNEIKQVISGNTAVGHRPKKASKEYLTKSILIQTYFKVNNQLVERGLDARGSPFPAHGSWRVKKNKLCFTYSDSIRKSGKEMCRKVIRKDDGTYEILRKGKVKRVWKEILPGNPHNLE
ncbi:MAG: hypothetical protein HKP55_04505 [Gammaproteobacteria bacterium]|nr:hypothetical protein [Gammaproteobacteria bacterium]